MTFAREGLIENRAELEPLFDAHWQDVTPDFCNVELGFDWETYAALEETGQVHLMVARESGKIAGYHLCLARRHLHSIETQVATTAFFFLIPEFRSGWNGVELFRSTEVSLKSLGIQSLYVGSKITKDLSPIFLRLGYHQVETIWAKVIA